MITNEKILSTVVMLIQEIDVKALLSTPLAGYISIKYTEPIYNLA